MLTRSGLGAGIVAVIAALCGWWWHYEELVVIACCVAILLMVALWSARSRHRTHIVREVMSPRVARGDPIRVVYHATNSTHRRSAPAMIVDRCDTAVIRVPMPAISADGMADLGGAIPTRRRGLFEVGPWEVERVDPFGLALGRRSSHQTGPIIVHPRIHALHGPYGSMHTVEDEATIRRAASDPLSGFVSLREYVDGDDPRLIHWPTSARMGTLMLREHVELRRPEFTVVLDASNQVALADDFEEMVDVAASIAVHAIRSGVDVVVRTTARETPGSRHPIERETKVLDLLTPVAQAPHGAVTMLPELFRSGLDHTTIILVTGPDGPSSTLSHTERLSVVRIGEGATATHGIQLAASDAAEFVQRWRPWP